MSLSEDLFYFPFFFAFYFVWWWFDKIASVLFGLREGREKRCMKHVMNLPCFRETEFVCHWGYLGNYLERSVSPWGEFGGVIRSLDVRSFQPDLFSFFVSFELGCFDQPFLRFTHGLLGLLAG
jgi:hypothetical protein